MASLRRPRWPEEAKWQFLTLIFEDVWLDDRRVMAVQPKPSVMAFFEGPALLF